MLQPLFDRVVFKQVKTEKTPSGLYLPNIDQKLAKGEVVSVGRGHMEFGALVEVTVKAGDIILYNSLAATEIEDSDGTKYMVIREGDIVSIVT